jgi:putative ATP-binding cassette transporter
LEGEILVNENLVTSSNELKDLISAVFTDNYILSKNYDDYKLEGNTQYHELLQIMALTEVVQDDTEESARRSLSKGQSKRMSLILALLENKPILVLDEWAADQDPHFRRYFYENLLPKLKKQGKTVIAVTHDDAYFKYADRVIKFDYGQIADESTEQNYAFTKS